MGKLKGKVTKPGDNGMLRYKNDAGEKIDVAYDQPNSKELGIAEGTVVTFELLMNTRQPMAVAINPIEKGNIQDIDYDKGSGTILETESGLVYPFRQNYLKDSGFAKDQTVCYTLAYVNGAVVALCLTYPQN
jgi:hypothetical protein